MSGIRLIHRASRVIRRASTFAVATAPVLLGWTATATGCPVCFAADERARMSFLGTAVFLSALPFLLFAGLAFWFWRELGRTAAPPGDLVSSSDDRRSRLP